MLHERDDRIAVALPNRLIVIVQELKTAPVVSAQVWVKTGSIYEQEHVGAGLSHFLEHLVSGGTTTHRTEPESNAELARIGARTNAATSLANVRYYINTTAGYTEQAIDLLSDWLQHASIPEAEYERERQVIQREFDMGRGEPGRIFWKLTQQARYQRHPARHPTIGYLDEFLTVSREQIVSFYERMYAPNNMVFVVVGDVDKQTVVDRVRRQWADARARSLPSLSFPREPELDGPVEKTGRADVSRPRVRLAWPGTRLGETHDYALDLLATLLGQGESSRLVREMRDRRGLVSSISSYNLSFGWGEGFFGVDAEIAPFTLPDASEAGEGSQTGDGSPAGASSRAGDGAKSQSDRALAERRMAAVKEAILAELERVREEGVDEAELDKAKRQTLARQYYGSQSAQAVASRLARDVLSMGDLDYTARYVEAVQRITPGQIQAAAEAMLRPDRMITVKLLPLTEDASPTAATRPDEAPAESEPAESDPVESIELDNRKLIESIRRHGREASSARRPVRIDPLRMVELSNGLRVILGRSTLTPTVSLQWYQLGGLLADAPGREGVAHATASMMRRGTTDRSADEIALTLDRLGARLSTSSGNNTIYARMRLLGRDFEEAADIFADVVLNPAFTSDEWDRMKPRLLAGIARIRDRWSSELQARFREAYFDEHPWSQFPLGRAEVVQGLGAEDLRAFHRARLGASTAVLALFGDFDPQEAIEALESRFGAMPREPAEPFEPPTPPSPDPGVRFHETSKPLVGVQIGLGPGMTLGDEDYPAMLVLSRVISRFPSGWIDRELRGDEGGLVYSVGAWAWAGLQPGYFGILFNTDPPSTPEAVRRSLEVVRRARRRDVDEPTLARARAAALTDEFLSRQTNPDRATQSALNVLYGLGLDRDQSLLRSLRTTRAKDLRRVAREHLRDPLVTVLFSEPVDRAALEALVEEWTSPDSQDSQDGQDSQDASASSETDEQGF